MKRVLFVDAVEPPAEFPVDPSGSVEQWFGRHLKRERDLQVQTLRISSPQLAAESGTADGIIISGSPRDAWADTSDVLEMLVFARRILSGRQPVLGVCFGHQLLGRALGGSVGRNPAGWEVGSRTVGLTAAGLKSPLFDGFHYEFAVIQGHRDAVLALPPRAKILATNGHTPIQAFSLDERIFGVQFHPEMDGDILRRLWTERRERLRGEVSFDLDEALDSAEADASCVFHNFAAMLQ